MGVFGRRPSIPLVDWVCMTGLSGRRNWKEAQKAQPWAGLTCMTTVGAASQAAVARTLTSSRMGQGSQPPSWGRAVATTAGSCCCHEDILRRE